MSASKIVLGTVQFGCQYGINSAGRPDSGMVSDILTQARSAGITTLDTSSAYGDAEQVLGLSMESADIFRIVSKYPKGVRSVEEMFSLSLHRLGCKSLYGYLLHHFEVWRDNHGIWDEFRRLRDKGLVIKAGFSIYLPEELEMLLDAGVDFDILQYPRNIFDRKFDQYLPDLKSRGVEVHVRSTFLQGLFFKDRNSLGEKLSPMRKYLLDLDEYCAFEGVTTAEAALNFNLQNPGIDGVLIGVDNVGQLRTNLASVREIGTFPDIQVKEKELLNPVNWN